MRPMIETRVDEWVSVMGSEYADAGKSLDFAEWCGFLTYDIMTELCFGEPLGFVRQMRDYLELAKSFRVFAVPQGLWCRLPEMLKAVQSTPVIKNLFIPAANNRTALGVIMMTRNELIKKRMEKPTNERDILNQ